MPHHVDVLAAGRVGGEPALFHGCRGQGGETDDISDREDVIYLGPEIRPHLDPATVVGAQARVGEVQRGGEPLATGRVHDGVRGQPLAAFQQRQRPAVVASHRQHRLAEPEGNGKVAQVVFEGFDYLHVAEVEHSVPAFDDCHLRTERREHGRVLDTDHTGADDDHRAGDLVQGQDLIAVNHRAAVEVDCAWPGRPGSGRNDDLFRVDPPLVDLVGALDADGMRVDEACRTDEQRDPVTAELAANDVDLTPDDVLCA